MVYLLCIALQWVEVYVILINVLPEAKPLIHIVDGWIRITLQANTSSCETTDAYNFT